MLIATLLNDDDYSYDLVIGTREQVLYRRGQQRGHPSRLGCVLGPARRKR